MHPVAALCIGLWLARICAAETVRAFILPWSDTSGTIGPKLVQFAPGPEPKVPLADELSSHVFVHRPPGEHTCGATTPTFIVSMIVYAHERKNGVPLNLATSLGAYIDETLATKCAYNLGFSILVNDRYDASSPTTSGESVYGNLREQITSFARTRQVPVAAALALWTTDVQGKVPYGFLRRLGLHYLSTTVEQYFLAARIRPTHVYAFIGDADVQSIKFQPGGTQMTVFDAYSKVIAGSSEEDFPWVVSGGYQCPRPTDWPASRDPARRDSGAKSDSAQTLEPGAGAGGASSHEPAADRVLFLESMSKQVVRAVEADRRVRMDSHSSLPTATYVAEPNMLISMHWARSIAESFPGLDHFGVMGGGISGQYQHSCESRAVLIAAIRVTNLMHKPRLAAVNNLALRVRMIDAPITTDCESLQRASVGRGMFTDSELESTKTQLKRFTGLNRCFGLAIDRIEAGLRSCGEESYCCKVIETLSELTTSDGQTRIGLMIIKSLTSRYVHAFPGLMWQQVVSTLYALLSTATLEKGTDPASAARFYRPPTETSGCIEHFVGPLWEDNIIKTSQLLQLGSHDVGRVARHLSQECKLEGVPVPEIEAVVNLVLEEAVALGRDLQLVI